MPVLQRLALPTSASMLSLVLRKLPCTPLKYICLPAPSYYISAPMPTPRANALSYCAAQASLLTSAPMLTAVARQPPSPSYITCLFQPLRLGLLLPDLG
eukprot:1039428-Pelagomonas_calceolata.AAC.1